MDENKRKIAKLKVERLPLVGEGAVEPHPKNPRKHPKSGSPEWEALKRSLRNEYFDPLVVNKRNNRLISGHLRRKIFIEEGVIEADMVVVDVSEEKHIAMMIAANRQQGEDDSELLYQLLEEMEQDDFDITGFVEDIDATLKALEKTKAENYTRKIEVPIYEPKGEKPKVGELYDTKKTEQLIAKIEASNVSDEEKAFLKAAAQRHTVLDFHAIAEYYVRASKEMQALMEDNALVIIDVNKAIENGFVKLTYDLAKLVGEEGDGEPQLRGVHSKSRASR